MTVLEDSAGDPEAFIRAVWDLHRRIVAIGPNQVLRETYLSLETYVEQHATRASRERSATNSEYSRDGSTCTARWSMPSSPATRPVPARPLRRTLTEQSLLAARSRMQCLTEGSGLWLPSHITVITVYWRSRSSPH